MENKDSRHEQQGHNDPTQKKQNQWDEQNKQGGQQHDKQGQQHDKQGQHGQQGQKSPQSDWDQNQDKQRKQA